MENSLKKVVADYNKQRGVPDSAGSSSFSESNNKNPSAKVRINRENREEKFFLVVL